MNIEVRSVSQVGASPAGASPTTFSWPSQTTVSEFSAAAHSLPGWLISYGIAPYSTTFSLKYASSWTKAPWKKKNITTFATISATVRIGNLRVGMSSLSGNTGGR
jgi:hypothetical protein